MNRVVWRATGYPELQALGFEARRCEAMVAADFGALDRLLSDALTWSHASARQVDKPIFLAELRGGHTRYLMPSDNYDERCATTSGQNLTLGALV